MKFDIFLSICQTEVDGYLPSEKKMFENFFDQLKLADDLGFGVAWVAETHLSCQIQKQNSKPVVPHFKGEIGLNTDILQLAHIGFTKTKKIHIGSAIRNIICNGGPIAHAESVRTFLKLHEIAGPKNRELHLGFAAGRFPFSNSPYGFKPKNPFERSTWDVIKNKYFQQGTEIFLRLLSGEHISARDTTPLFIRPKDFRSQKDWENAQVAYFEMTGDRTSLTKDEFPLGCHWDFEKVGVIPFDVSFDQLKLTIGTHDPETQVFANKFMPVGVFNLSITPPEIIEDTHLRMAKSYNAKGGPWKRELMPRTVMIFLEDSPQLSATENSKKAKEKAERAWKNYWDAMEGTIDDQKVKNAVSNTIAGNPEEILTLLKSKYHKDDRLLTWFDFNNHDNEDVKKSMKIFIEKIAPQL